MGVSNDFLLIFNRFIPVSNWIVQLRILICKISKNPSIQKTDLIFVRGTEVKWINKNHQDKHQTGFTFISSALVHDTCIAM